MIVVLADDFSGAAEVGGAAFRCGFRTELCTGLEFLGSPAVRVVDTNTRALPAAQAGHKVDKVIQVILKNRPTWVYKKVDSVLRGPILAELQAILYQTHFRRCLLVPANPSRRRVVWNGIYSVDGKPLDRTPFANDPQHPATSSAVVEMLKAGTHDNVVSIRVGQDLPDEGIAIADAKDQGDLEHWAAVADHETILAGAVEFFETLLAARESHKPDGPPAPPGVVQGRTLLVCGSTASWPRRKQQAAQQGLPVVKMPEHTTNSSALIEKWVQSTIAEIQSSPRVMIAIGEPDGISVSPTVLSGWLAETVEQVLQQSRIDRLLVEGGHTASTIVRQMNWTRFEVVQELMPGVVGLQIMDCAGPCLIVKPGSYDWPDSVWQGP